MQILVIAGNVGNVKEVRDVGDDCVLNFSIAVDNGKDKNGERRESTWYDCSLWGKRARSLAPYITKGSKLTVQGRPTARAHEGKAYLGVNVSDLTFTSSKSDGERSPGGGVDDIRRVGRDAEPQYDSYDSGFSQSSKPSTDSYDLNDDIPF